MVHRRGGGHRRRVERLHLALWLKGNGFRADQVQAFYPSSAFPSPTLFPLQRLSRSLASAARDMDPRMVV
ncbi:hypothetical protein, partial [Pseudomonas mandelii]|uniref:hypothetical protein n=1 Tax=Pseudomonas mandelii TaxID=75612 RepID=UPI003D08DDFE